MAEFLDMSLKQPQLALKVDSIGLQFCDSAFYVLVDSLQSIVSGIKGLY